MRHLRHDERLLPRLSQNAVHKEWRAGKGVLAPLPAFVKAQPATDTQQLLLTQGKASSTPPANEPGAASEQRRRFTFDGRGSAWLSNDQRV